MQKVNDAMKRFSPPRGRVKLAKTSREVIELSMILKRALKMELDMSLRNMGGMYVRMSVLPVESGTSDDNKNEEINNQTTIEEVLC